MINLLEIIKKDQDHPFHNHVIISDDFKKIKTFNGRSLTIYGENTCLESLAREIIVNILIKEEKRFYNEEEKNEQGGRYDLISKCLSDQQVQNIIEFTNMDLGESINKLNLELETKFIQIKTQYIDNLPHRNKDFYTTVIMTDIVKLVQNPLLLEKFMTISNEEKSINGIDLFKKYGLYIETRRYNSIKEGYIDNSKKWYQIPKHCIFELSPQQDVFGEKSKICKIKNAIHLPSSSSEFGIKNVRDIKDPEIFSAKRVLVKDILDTLIEAFKSNDKNLLANNGKEKDFVYIENETIIHTIDYGDNKRFAVVTLNGAIVDGQNSLDALRIIINILDCILKNDKLDTKFKESIFDKIIYTNKSKESLEEFKQFILESHVLIKTTTCKDVKKAREIAISKNNTMEVTKNELTMSENIEKIQFLSNQVLLKENYIIGYPKKENFGVSKKMLATNMIMADSLALYFKSYKDISGKKSLETKEIFSISQKLTKEIAVSELEDFTKKFISEAKIDEKSNILNKDYIALEAAKEKINYFNNRIKELKSDLNNKNNENSFEYINQNIKSYTEQLKNDENEKNILEKKLENNKRTIYKIGDEELLILINLIKSICTLREVVANSDFILNYPKNSVINKNSVPYFLFVLIVYKTKTDLKTSFRKEICVDMLSKLPIAMNYLMNTYPSGITDIRNSKEGFVVNVNGISVKKEQARQEFLDFFLKD